MFIISSPQNPRVKDAVRLRDRRHREKQDRILIDGARELLRAVAAGVHLVELFVCEPLCRSEDAGGVVEALPQDCEVLHVSEAVFEKLAFGQRAEGLLGVADMPRPTLHTLAARWQGEPPSLGATAGLPSSAGRTVGQANRGTQQASFVLPQHPLVAVLEGVEKPGNVGAVLRSADAAGVSAVILADGRTDLYNPNAIRASLGTIFTMPVCTAASDETLVWLRERQFAILAARVDGSIVYTEASYRGPTAVVLGSEASGLSPVWTAQDIKPIRLPMLGVADSLNVSVTAAVLFYEAMRQRDARPR